MAKIVGEEFLQEVEVNSVAPLPYIFISHADSDNPVADRLYDELTKLGLQPWIDHKQLPVGKSWERAINQAMRESWGGILMISRKALESTACTGERQYFVRKMEEKKVFIALIETFDLDDLPFTLPVIQFLDLSKNFEKGVEELVATVAANMPRGFNSFSED